jgi:hypothetical protein
MNATESEVIQEKPGVVGKHEEVPNEEVALGTIGVWRIDLGTSDRP